jgi:hypothetical protein
VSLRTIRSGPEPMDIMKARTRYYQHRALRRQLEVRISMSESGLAFLGRVKQAGLKRMA